MPDDLLAVAMSGGVDSYVVAGLMSRSGQPVVGLTMQLWNLRRLPDLVEASINAVLAASSRLRRMSPCYA